MRSWLRPTAPERCLLPGGKRSAAPVPASRASPPSTPSPVPPLPRAAGSERRSIKAGPHLPRDLSLLAYLALSGLVYFTSSVPLALLVLALNALNLAVCFLLKSE